MAPQPGIGRHDEIAAEALLAGLTSFSARAGHDILGSLNQAHTLLALFIKRHGDSSDPQSALLLNFLQSSSNRIEGVLAGLRRYLEIASRRPSFAAVDLNGSVASSLALLEKEIAESGAVIALGRLPMVSADSAQMAAVFEILIGNAIKFRQPDAPPRVQVSVLREGDLQSISIADNGIGIDPEYSETVFLPFKRLHGAEYPGAGLGLAVARLIVGMHGGRIRINPEGTKRTGGTDVLFTVPSAYY